MNRFSYSILFSLLTFPAIAGGVATDCNVGLPGVPLNSPTHLATDINGRLCLLNPSASNPANGTFGQVLPTIGTAIGVADPTNNLKPLNVDAAGNLKTTITNPTIAVIPGNNFHVGSESVITNTVTAAPGDYAIRDVIGGPQNFAGIFRTVGGSGILASATLTIPAVIPNGLFTLYLFEKLPTAALVDNSAIALNTSDWDTYINSWAINTFQPDGMPMSVGTVIFQVPMPVRNRDTTATTNLYGVLVAENAGTIPAGVKLTLRLSRD